MIPLFITVYLILSIIRFATRYLGFDQNIVLGIISTIVLLILVYVMGFIAQHTVGNRITNWIARFMSKIPIAGTIYNASKQIMDSLMMNKSMAFQKAVIIEYPRAGLYSVAFVTKGRHKSSILKNDEEMLHIFVPTTPNPTSGFFLIIPQKDAIPLDMSVQDAFKLIISGGIVSYDNKTSDGGNIE